MRTILSEERGDANVITYRDRSASREIGKVLGIPVEEIDRLARYMRRFEYVDPDDTLERHLQRAGFDRGDRRIALFARLFQEIQESYWFGGRKIRIRWLPRELPSSVVTITSRVGFGMRPASNVIAWVPAPLVTPPSPLRVHV